jgi:exodeoxyribonuclease-3
MKIGTWNVNGIRRRQTEVCEWLARDHPDVVCLQELKAERAQVPPECAGTDYHVYWHGLRAYSGVSLHVRKGLLGTEPVFSHPDFDMESRIVQAELGQLVLASVYVPNGGKDYEAKLSFMAKLRNWAREIHRSGRELVLCGDINDLGRALDPDNANLFTWWAPWRNMRARNIGWRLDYILATPGIAARAQRCAVLADFGTSDHAPVVLETRND